MSRRECNCGLLDYGAVTRRQMGLTHAVDCDWHIDPEHLAEIKARERARDEDLRCKRCSGHGVLDAALHTCPDCLGSGMVDGVPPAISPAEEAVMLGQFSRGEPVRGLMSDGNE